ncbi:hypothetical protein NPIL_235721 [Nephila pilipes]|uniref:Uncharacterized protein n=1 Tax=Nephila pilipes TaxID=299642 RepID=A0A8X6MLK5_NEPPI|nr:hypothetical protein NPIL_235721 [Nephila pilipes]
MPPTTLVSYHNSQIAIEFDDHHSNIPLQFVPRLQRAMRIIASTNHSSLQRVLRKSIRPHPIHASVVHKFNNFSAVIVINMVIWLGKRLPIPEQLRCACSPYFSMINIGVPRKALRRTSPFFQTYG